MVKQNRYTKSRVGQNAFLNYWELNNSKELSSCIARRYINPAVCLELSLCEMGPFKTGDYCQSFGYDDNPKVVTVKKCTCCLSKSNCPLHSVNVTDRSSGDGYPMRPASGADLAADFTPAYPNDSETSVDSKHSVHSTDTQRTFVIKNNSDSHCTILNKHRSESHCAILNRPQAQAREPVRDEMRLSLASLISESKTVVNKEELAYERWLEEKNRQKQKFEEEKKLLQEMLMQEKDKKLEMERQNFLKWLKHKKDAEKKKKDEDERRLREEEQKEAEKAQRQAISELKYKLWLKQKEEETLVKKMNEQLKKMKESEEKQKKKQMNAAAYEEWLKSSKNKPTPVPSNMGLDSLRTSVSVSYINPTPWQPNIESETKPSTK